MVSGGSASLRSLSLSVPSWRHAVAIYWSFSGFNREVGSGCVPAFDHFVDEGTTTETLLSCGRSGAAGEKRMRGTPGGLAEGGAFVLGQVAIACGNLGEVTADIAIG